jgi:hypothetical protein
VEALEQVADEHLGELASRLRARLGRQLGHRY